MVVKKKFSISDEREAIKLKDKLKILKDFHDQENIFLDFSARIKRTLLLKKVFKFKIYYRFESKANLLV